MLSRQHVFQKIGKQRANTFLEDSYGFIWIGGGRLYRHDAYSMQKYSPRIRNANQSSIGSTYALLEDTQKRIWVGASDGLFLYDRATDELVNYPIAGREKNRKFGRIMALLEDRQGRLWIGDKQRLYLKESPNLDSIKTIKGIDLGKKIQGALGIFTIVEGKDGKIFAASNDGLWAMQQDSAIQLLPKKWKKGEAEFQIFDAKVNHQNILFLATIDGLWLYDIEQQSFSKREIPVELGSKIVEILFDKSNNLWIGTSEDGLFKIMEDSDSFEQFTQESANASYTLYDNRIISLMQDRFDNLWIGTFSGINRINFEQQQFPFYQIDPGAYKRDNFTFRVLEDSLGGLWFRLLRLGLGYAPDLEEKCEILLNPPPGSIIEEIKNFCLDADGNVWVLTLTNGLYKFEKGRKEPQHIASLKDFMRSAYPLTIISDRINTEYLWFTSRLGLCRVNRFTYEIKCFSPKDDLTWIDNVGITHVTQSTDGNFWCGSNYFSAPIIIYFDYEQSKFMAERQNAKHPSSIRYKGTRNTVALPENEILLSTVDIGIIKIDATNNTYTLLNKQGALKNIQSIMSDLEGNIWFTTLRKICKFDYKNCYCYDQTNDIESFAYSSATRGNDGRLTFGGSNGIYSFYPNEIEFDTTTVHPKVYLTNFKVHNQKRHLDKAYELVERIELPFKENEFTFEFTALDFLHTNKIKYKYRLLGYDKNWKAIGNQRQVSYTNLNPRNYTFQVMASSDFDTWSAVEEGLNINVKITPPIYRTWGAYFLYFLSGFSLIYAFYRFQLNRQLAKEETQRLKELDEIKTNIYTNITHEFRTPLTVILGMAKNIRTAPEKWSAKGSKLIERNGQNLLTLVNQMLDLSKLEAGKLEVNSVQSDLIAYLHYLVESFHSWAASKNIQLHFLPDVEELWMDFDPEKIQAIVSNLLSNAIKFTPSEGSIYLQLQKVEEEKVLLKVRDTGKGMTKQELENIFDRFYQIDSGATREGEGTGIGLTLTKALVELLHGKIEVKSKLKKGSEFLVYLPIERNANLLENIENNSIERRAEQPILSVSNVVNNQLPLVLLVEDNQDVIAYLTSCLEEQYRLAIAHDGQEGIDKTLELSPDLIVSDVMMPKKNGFELCETLKKHPQSSHIPIILLTAKADIDSKIEGLSTGADAYLPKPFQEEELLVRIQKLLELRQQLKQYYTSSDFLNRPTPPTENQDEIFLHQLKTYIEEELDSPNLDVELLCKKMGLSRTAFYNKVNALVGTPPATYIRLIRLNYAKKLLLQTDLSITEIAYQCGFSSQSLFSRTFTAQEGVSPSLFRRRDSAI